MWRIEMYMIHYIYVLQVFGWDIEWNVNWGASSLRESARDIMDLVQTVIPKEGNKIVILTHDLGLRSDSAQAELGKFIEMGKKAGYKFRTLETYTQD